MKILKCLCLLLFLNLAIFFPVTSDASQVDFGWSTPEYFSHNKNPEDEKKYLIWVFSIKNTIDQEITVPVATILSTDTDKYYEAKYIPEIAGKVSEDGERYLSPDKMKGDYGPGVSRKGIAIFEDIDPYAQKINIFMTGLSHFFFWRWRLSDYSYKITYKRSGSKWILEEHGFSKDNSHRDYVDKFKGAQPEINYWP
ncbi:MAG: hypothetical protein HON76_16965 [Candidatus Scalindua sp.]|jgi:hypothetical protein|nr:hypothetical protein [Candidatus Scalindua sp.]MBT5305436.1 hypothetical protein [Candidatus Scalindua sp.]MBT6227230.1 hypothetical protein [Candidatus Scalindua sp.]MBT6564209.1 hypothetical protein [Candidatus Scalindua sp.]MBT7209794.1 hypothetical protein [Candidatus Scalindua sp.]